MIETLLFFDFEVFKYDFLVVIMKPSTKETIIIHNDPDQLKRFYEDHKNYIWCGYNVRGYDQYILKSIILDMNPYKVSKHIIDGGFGWQYSNKFNNVQLYTYDVIVKGNSLKELEAFMGHDIKESEVDFDIDRPLTPEELEETIKYCKHDVYECAEVFLQTKKEFDAQMSLLKAFKLPMKYISKTKPQLSAIILGAVKKSYDDEFKLIFPDPIIIKNPAYQDIFLWYIEPGNMDYDKYQEVYVSGVKHRFGWGGLHGSIDNYICDNGIFVSCDVASLYPAIMINFGFLSRNVQERDKYREIRDTRLKLKAEKNPMEKPYKIVLNSTFGASKDKYNNLYDPLMANCVCVGGQLLLLDLIEKLEPYWQLIQSNTDGLIGKIESTDQLDTIKSIAAEWEQRTGLVLEWDIYTKIFQKDVNNYIVVDAEGKYKSKGAYVKKLSPIDFNLPILNKAVVDYFVKGVKVEETILACDDLIMFQSVNKLTYKYTHAMHGNAKLREKCLRVFASNDRNDPGVFKVKKETGKAEKIAGTPEHCFIDNGNVIDKKVPEKLDKDWYINEAKKRINDFIGESELPIVNDQMMSII